MNQPEYDKAPKGTTFSIQKPELIYEAASRGIKAGELTDTLLESPLDNIEMGLTSDTSTFDLDTRIKFSFDARHHGGLRSETIMNQVRTEMSQHGEVLERGGNYVFSGARGTRFVLGREISLDWLNLTTGKAKDIIDTKQLFPSPELDEETLNNALKDSVDVLDTIVRASYAAMGKPVPNQEVVIAPPKVSVNGRLGSAALKGAEGLIDKIEVERPKVSFKDIGGQDRAKRELEGLSFALSNPDLYQKWGTKPPKGILLYGPPGTGKTLMAKALASEAHARFLHVKASDIGSKWYGESEQIVQQIFDFAGQGQGKTIIYFDEIDSIAPRREGSHEATQRVIGTLLQNIDGMGASENIMIVASTNRMDSIDDAMLRPGRLDRLVEVGLPDADDRKTIFAIHMDKANQIADGNDLFNGIDMKEIAKETDGCSGADVAEIIRRTLEEKVRQEGSGQQPTPVTTADIRYQIANYERIRQSRSQTLRIQGPYRPDLN